MTTHFCKYDHPPLSFISKTKKNNVVMGSYEGIEEIEDEEREEEGKVEIHGERWRTDLLVVVVVVGAVVVAQEGQAVVDQLALGS